MKETKSYIDMLINSLQKKYDVLVILDKNERKQEEALAGQKVTPDELNALFDEKNNCINKLEELDLGFERLYERTREEINANKDMYKKEIILMQDIIRRISDLTVSLQARQTRNRERYMAFFENKKQEVKKFKRSSKTVSSYYKNMYNSHQEGESYFLDRKK